LSSGRWTIGDRRTLEALPAGETLAPDKLEGVRARGELRLTFAATDGRTRMVEAYQSGCLRARVPYAEAGEPLNAILINTGGGVTGGDRLVQSVAWRQGAHAVVASQAAEKVYRSVCGDVEIDTRLAVEAGAVAEWLPQETILFDRARLSRRIDIDLAQGASFLGVEAVILGRAAMGETVREGFLRDAWRIRREGRLVYADAQSLCGRIDQMMDRAAIGSGARAMAVAVFAHRDAALMLPAVREALTMAQGRGGASAWNGLLVARLLAGDGQTMRRNLVAVLSALRGGRALPRVWTC